MSTAVEKERIVLLFVLLRNLCHNMVRSLCADVKVYTYLELYNSA